MKTAILILALLGLQTTQAQTRGQGTRGDNTDRQIEVLTDSISRAILDQRAHIYLDAASKNTLLNRLQDVSSLLRPQYPNYPGYGMRVRAFADDQCQNLITEIKQGDSCSLLNSVFASRNVWSIALGEQCLNIADRSFTSSCQQLMDVAAQPMTSQPVVTLYTDDECKNTLIPLDPRVNYQVLEPFLSSFNVWSLSVENHCVNIPDVRFSAATAQGWIQAATTMRRGYSNANNIEFFSDDQCQNPITYVQSGDDCGGLNKFFTGKNVWSIKFRGACENIADMSFAAACATYTR